jgi:hypothetical protein
MTSSIIIPTLLMVPLIVIELLPAAAVPAFSKILPAIAGLDDLINLISFKFALNIDVFIRIE